MRISSTSVVAGTALVVLLAVVGTGGVAGPVAAGPTPTAGPQPTPTPGGTELPERISPASADPSVLAAAVSRATFAADDGLFGVVASSQNHADALAGSALAGGVGPLLLAAPHRLPDPTADELTRVLPAGATVYLLGGTAALGDEVSDAIGDLGFEVHRLAGPERAATAAAVAREVVEVFGPTPTVFLVNGFDWPDAVMAGGPASQYALPVVLVGSDHVPAPTLDVLGELDPDELQVVGGTAVVSEDVVDAVTTAIGERPGRLAGGERTGTAEAVGRYTIDRMAADGFAEPIGVVVNARRFFGDALVATTLTGVHRGVFIPVEGAGGDTVTRPALDLVCGRGLDLVVVGGPDVVTEDSEATIRRANDEPCP